MKMNHNIFDVHTTAISVTPDGKLVSIAFYAKGESNLIANLPRAVFELLRKLVAGISILDTSS